MKLKTRLVVAFLIILVVPIILVGIAFMGFSRYQMNIIEKNYGITVSIDNVSDSMQVIGKSTQELFEEMEQQAESDPERFLDTEYLEQMNEKLSDKHSFLLVRKNGTLFYNGSDMDVTKLFKKLPEYRDFVSAADGGSYIGNGIAAFVKQMDLELSNRAEVSVFIISSANKIISQTKSLLLDLMISIVVILIFTVFAMIMWIYTGIHTPLQKLSEATHRIKEGDFDFEMDVKGNDEISAVCRDFDEMRQRLKDLDEEKKTFDRQSKELISNISHDLKTPITAVKGYVEGIMDGVADTPEKMDRYIRTIYIKANDMDRLINELTFYSKIDTNKIPYHFNKIDVTEYFDDCAEEVGLEMRERNIVFSYINTVEPGTLIIADAEQLKRVVNNIIGNSVKYMDKEKKYVQIRVMDVGDFIQVDLEDNGKGIPNKEIASIFDRFYRTDLSRNSAQGGSGIGLSIVKKIIEDHGGRIWASSRVGEGTIMHFEIRKYQEVPLNE
jgi:signal transduction histidine kinase